MAFYESVVITRPELTDTQVESLINQRNEARASKDWNKSDSIRDELSAIGVEVQDTSDGTTWKLI